MNPNSNRFSIFFYVLLLLSFPSYVQHPTDSIFPFLFFSLNGIPVQLLFGHWTNFFLILLFRSERSPSNSYLATELKKSFYSDFFDFIFSIRVIFIFWPRSAGKILAEIDWLCERETLIGWINKQYHVRETSRLAGLLQTSERTGSLSWFRSRPTSWRPRSYSDFFFPISCCW